MKKQLLLFLVFAAITNFSIAQNYRLWASYYGGSADDFANAVTTDAAGNVYVVGWTYSASGISSPGAYQTANAGGADAYLVKFNGAGVRLWATYYGGSGGDFGYGVRTDNSGNVYITGYTESTTGIASPGAFQSTFNGVDDAFLVKFDSNGNRLWATYCGGSDFDQGADVATDAAGNVYMTGATGSITDIGTGGTHQPSSGGFQDAFLVKYNSSGTRLWGSYFGGSDQDYGFDIAVDASGNIVIGGSTSSTNSIASGGFQNVSGGDQDAFVAKFNPSGNTIWSTYYGGTGTEWGFGIATGPSGFIYLSGRTDSPNNIASGGFQNTFGGWADAYLVKFDAAGNRVWGTYYGGTGNDEGTDVAADAFGNVFLTSDTYTPNVGNCIATPYGFQNTLIGTENLCLAAFTSNGFRASATYYGNLHEEEARVTVNVFGDVYLAGTVKSTTGIASGGHQNTFGGGNWDGGIVKFATAVPHEEVIVPNDSLPPTPPIITTNPPIIITSVGIYNGGGISISNAVFKNFSPGAPLPASGSSIISFTCDFTGTYNSGSGAIPVSCTALLKQKVELVQTALPLRIFDTEIIQLDLIGGTLPAGVVIRESPTLHSYGQIWITDQGGSFRMSYFVDANLEVTTNYGADWQADSPPARMEMRYGTPAAVPTLGEWGLIGLTILLLFSGIYFVSKKNQLV